MFDRRFLIHGFLPAFGSAFCFACMATLVKIASVDLPAPELVFLRSVVGLIIIIPIVVPRGRKFIRTPRLGMHMFRALISLSAMTCFFYSIGNIGLSEATLLNATSPLFIGLLAIVILGESLTRTTSLALLIGIIGITLILKPGTALFTTAALVGLASGFFIGCAKVLVRYMASTEPVLRTVFYFSVFCTLYSSIPLFWLWQMPELKHIVIMSLAGICATGGQMLLTYSFTHNEAVRVAPFTYVTVVLATLIGWLIWDELPDLGSFIGIVLVVTSCLTLTLKGKLPNPWRLKKPSS